MKKIILLFLVLAVPAVLGKLYVEHRYKEAFDMAIRLTPSETDISYRDITFGFDGSLTIHDFKVRNNEGPGSYFIKKVKAVTSDKFAFLKENAFQNKAPEWVKVQIEEFSIDTSLFNNVSKEQCTSFDTAYAFSEIGIDELQANMTIKIDLTDQENSKTIINYRDQASRYDLRLNFSYDQAKQSIVSRDTLPIHNIQLTSFLDSDHASKFNEYCAEQLDLSVEDYLSQVIGSPKFLYDSFGYNLGEDASQALINFMQGGQKIDIYSTPSEQLKKLRSLHLYSRESIFLWLNLDIQLNGQKVAVKSNTNNNFSTTKDSSDSGVKNKPRYQAVSVSNVPRLVNKNVKIWRKNNKAMVDGLMVKYFEETAFIKVRKYGGRAIYEVSIDDIKKVEVYK